ncbi:beta-galactosidase 7 isoform X1 [Zea mays]|uniref:beta-galactosidase 7 isoform X1 n=1 Tax=Zea mays TaxID=4577 RepID=UPI0009AACE41|nr:beta-galactosidase 7 isoform X1 [Zea mays]|eukprot:XP_020398852.1 beta-galactosidase 7 isoform X1 [Zea mays]
MAAAEIVVVAVVTLLLGLTSCMAESSVWREEDRRVRGEVTYEQRALVLDGARRMLFAGEMHYPRSTPEMWPKLIAKAKEGGLDVIQTYVFWNVHEPIQGQYNFEGRYDLVRFIKEIQAQGLYVSLRIGPFIESEWKYGGFPFWLHDVPNITFRSDNEPFKQHMQRFVTDIVNMMKHEGLYYPQGGPIITSQIENEYQMVEPAFGSSGQRYVSWAAAMAVDLQTGVPWTMCKQNDAPDPVINTCNGLICGETFVGPNSANKPALWTENWTSRYLIYGNDTKLRSPQDITFAVALFIARKNGSYVSYYMYHGGTNFGRFASSYVTTSYYDGAPLDEYGLIWQPTWGHLRELHAAVKQSSEPLLFGTYSNLSIGQEQEAHIFETETQCVAFLVNFDQHHISEVVFRNISLELAPKSISILLDCKQVVFETAKVNAQHGSRTAEEVQSFSDISTWKAFKEPIPQDVSKSAYSGNRLFEHLSTTKDATDYLWYIVGYEYTPSDDGQLVLINVESRAHILHAFVNNAYVGRIHGSHGGPANIIFSTNISLQEGPNTISLLSAMVGSPDSGAHMERRVFGIRKVSIQQGQEPENLLNNELWGYQVGLFGERNNIYTQDSKITEWTTIDNLTYSPLTWYKTTFSTPVGNDAVTLNLTGMGKGEVWVNGESIGRYWVSFKAPSGNPSQSLYHIPREFLNPQDNTLVLFEEMGGNPQLITVNTMSVSRVCGNVNELSAPSLQYKDKEPAVDLWCPEGKHISAIEFASYGGPTGDCKKFGFGRCHAGSSESVVKQACLGKSGCSVPVTPIKFGGDPCPGIQKSLLVVANYSFGESLARGFF